MEAPINVDVVFISNSATDRLREMTQHAINTLVASEDRSKICFKIVVVESFSKAALFQFEHANTIYPKGQFGYNRYLNIGICTGNSAYVCVCNNDLIFHSNWASQIIKAFNADNRLQSASPLCKEYHKNWKIDMEMENIYGYQIEREVCGWCIFFKRELTNSISLFDPRFRFWFADNDYALTLQKHGITHALVTSSLVDHLRSQTLEEKSREEKRRLTTREQFFFEYKWKGRSYLSYLFNFFLFETKVLLSVFLTAILDNIGNRGTA